MRGRKTGGRRQGTPNKATAAIRTYAQTFSREAIQILIQIAREKKADDKARVMAARELLDRAHGKPPQALTGPDGSELRIPAAVTFLVTKAPGADTRD